VTVAEHLPTYHQANFSRLSCPYLRAIFGRHHPLSSGLRKNPRQNRSGKKRQKAAMNLSQYDAFCRWQFAANCHLLPPAVMHPPSATKEPRQFSVRHLPLAQLEATTADANVARNLRNCCVTSSTQLNIIQHGSTSAVHTTGIVRPNHTQGSRKRAAKSGN
jgi:hypothetical protein